MNSTKTWVTQEAGISVGYDREAVSFRAFVGQPLANGELRFDAGAYMNTQGNALLIDVPARMDRLPLHHVVVSNSASIAGRPGPHRDYDATYTEFGDFKRIQGSWYGYKWLRAYYAHPMKATPVVISCDMDDDAEELELATAW